MPEPLSITALSLTCLQGCVKALVLIGKAQGYEQNVCDAQFRTTLILHSLSSWATAAGLTENPPTLLVNANDAQLVPQILRRLEALFADVKELRNRYGTHLLPTNEEVKLLEDEGPLPSSSSRQSRSWAERIDISTYLKRKQPWNRLRWVALDDEKYERLLGKAKGYVSELEAFLQHARRESMDAQLEFLLRDAILSADDRRLRIIQQEHRNPDTLSISAAANFKQARLSIGISPPLAVMPESTPGASPSRSLALSMQELRHENGTSPESLRLPMTLLKLNKSARSPAFRTLAEYDQRTVLLEWKYIIRDEKSTLPSRVNQVATLLHSSGPALHSLQCRGFVKDAPANRYGYIFELPWEFDTTSDYQRSTISAPETSSETSTQLDTLREVLEVTSAPALNVRLRFAVEILESLLNLHTAGWLHKEFRSENMLLISKNRTPSMSKEISLSTCAVYIAGYTHSRMDKPDETTEPLQTELEADLYRHPLLLSDVQQSYKKNFDIFSVGCILLEIGMWTPLRQLLENCVIAGSNAERQRSPEALSQSVPQFGHRSDLGHEDERDKSPEDYAKHKAGLAALKQELLCAQPLTAENFASKDSLTSRDSREIVFACLESNMGKRYAAIVRDLLRGTDIEEYCSLDEHASALVLEMRARATVLAIAEAV